MSAIAFLSRNPSAGLLIVQLLGLPLYALMEASPFGRAFFGAFGVLVLAVAVASYEAAPG